MIKRRLGQNFLVDPRIARNLAEAAEITKEDAVLEVGAGTGAITKELARRAQKVIAVELDRDLIPVLKKGLEGFRNIEIRNANILDLDFEDLNHFKVVGAIPYQITSPLIHKILHSRNRPESITLIVQKEVAEKIVAPPPKSTYLANFVANFGEARIVRRIRPAAFRPKPKVDSALIHIRLFPHPQIEDTAELEKFLHRGFGTPRKMIKQRFPTEFLEKAGVAPHQRPAALSREDWRNLYRELSRVHERGKTRRGGGIWRTY